MLRLLALTTVSVLALQAHAGPATNPWPLSNAHHRAYFCANKAEMENTPPAGYVRAEDRELVALAKKGASPAKAMLQLQARARCNDLPMEASFQIELAPVGLERR